MKEFIGRVIAFFRFLGLFSTSLCLSSADLCTQACMSFKGTSESLVKTDSGASSLGVFALSVFAGLGFLVLGALEPSEVLLVTVWERFGFVLLPLLLRSEALGVGGELVYWNGTGDLETAVSYLFLRTHCRNLLDIDWQVQGSVLGLAVGSTLDFHTRPRCL